MIHRVKRGAIVLLLGASGPALSACAAGGDDPSPEQPVAAAQDSQLPGGAAESHVLGDGEKVAGLTTGQVVVAGRPETGSSSVRVLNVANARTIWSSEERFAGADVTVIDVDGEVVIVELDSPSSETMIAGLGAESGSILWTLPTQRQDFQPVPGTGTGILQTGSVPLVISTVTGGELWRGEPGDTMRVNLGTAMVTDPDGRTTHFDLIDGRSVQARAGLKANNSKGASPAGPGSWASGTGVWGANGAIAWGNPKDRSGHSVGDASHVATLTTSGTSWEARLHQTKSGEQIGVTQVDTCPKAAPIGYTRGILIWRCPGADENEFMRARLNNTAETSDSS